MIPVVCHHNGCGYEGEPVKSRELLRAKAVWLCESCGGVLPIKVVPQRKRARRWDEALDDEWKGYE